MGSDNIEEALDLKLTVENVIVVPIVTLATIFLLYGMYTIIFGLCIHILYRRKQSSSGLYLPCTMMLFALATLYMAMDAFGYTRQAMTTFRASKTRDFKPYLQYLPQDKAKTAWVSTIILTDNFMRSIADIMLVGVPIRKSFRDC
ncbi:hypothetical protein PM082_024772 [Marasmius tenuissimus]|nr:hypothetical protein PM082_024772 [Marasmius tenuissimus]